MQRLRKSLISPLSLDPLQSLLLLNVPKRLRCIRNRPFGIYPWQAMNKSMRFRNVKSDRLIKGRVMLDQEFQASALILSGISKVLLHTLRCPKTPPTGKTGVRKDISALKGDLLVLGPKVGIETLDGREWFAWMCAGGYMVHSLLAELASRLRKYF